MSRHLELRIESDFTDFNVVFSPLLKVVQSFEGQAFVFFISFEKRRQVVAVVMLLEVVPGLLLGDRTTALRGELLLQNGVKILIFSHLPASPEHCQRFLRQAKLGQVSLVFLPGEPGGQCRWRFQPPPALLHQPDQHAAEGQQQGQLPWAYRPGGPERF